MQEDLLNKIITKKCTLKDVPIENIDYPLAKEAVRLDGTMLKYTPFFLREREMYLAAVGSVGYMLKYVPFNLRDYDLCLSAVSLDGYILEYIPTKLQRFVLDCSWTRRIRAGIRTNRV